MNVTVIVTFAMTVTVTLPLYIKVTWKGIGNVQSDNNGNDDVTANSLHASVPNQTL